MRQAELGLEVDSNRHAGKTVDCKEQQFGVPLLLAQVRGVDERTGLARAWIARD